MKSLISTSFMLLFVWAISLTGVSAQTEFPKLDKSPADLAFLVVDKQPMAKVVYSRPAKNGRTIFGELVPFGDVWRTGANEATEITFMSDAKFGGKDVKAGSYSLFTIPGKDSWTIILSNQTNVWGAYNYDESKDALRVEVPVAKTDMTVENFSIMFTDRAKKSNLVLAWDDTMVKIPVEVM
ncbi:DUF2911 domain-containing protein [Pontibacter sp. G13]|uniref:DUF2911 domain-containing protein n=1 Tax=Pontibacter sp. G13 TaxID=3074898 RepID=UPI00288B54FE|nr:DUF2911 domain-containing protein [Pontibacter sp. G13]WNJ18889.1 DUF2911 domain-containing protein [Pontibacter sp. G13]